MHKLLTAVLVFCQNIVSERWHMELCDGTWLLNGDLHQQAVHDLTRIDVDRVVVVPAPPLEQFIVGQGEGHLAEGRDIYRNLELVCVPWSERQCFMLRVYYEQPRCIMKYFIGRLFFVCVWYKYLISTCTWSEYSYLNCFYAFVPNTVSCFYVYRIQLHVSMATR